MPNVDDAAAAVSYSGGWSKLATSQANAGSVTVTSNPGSTATIRFSGTSITVFGTNPATSGGYIRATFIIDNRAESWTKDTHAHSYYRDRFWGSGHLKEGDHTLIVRNEGSQVPLHLDFFEVEGSVINPAPSTPQNTNTNTHTPNNPPVNTQTHTQTHVVSQTVTQTVTDTKTDQVTNTHSATETNTVTPSPSTSPTTTSTPALLQTNTTLSNVISQSISTDSNGGTVTAFQVVTTSVSGTATEVTVYPNGDGGFSPTGASSKGVPLGALIGAVVGSVIFLIFFILLLVLCTRRRRRNAALAQSAATEDPSGGMRENRPQGANGISAFPARLSESLRPGVASKYRKQQERPFHRLSEEASDSNYSTARSPTDSSTATPYDAPPPHRLSLNLYRNEKDTGLSLFDAGPSGINNRASVGFSSDSTHPDPSPIVSNASHYEESMYTAYDQPPPAYHSGRESSLYPSGDVRVSVRSSTVAQAA